MVDANIIISAGLFPKSIVGKVLAHVAKNHELVLCQYILKELENVFKNKFTKRMEYLRKFVRRLKYEFVNVDIINNKKYPNIRDIDDLPVLANAIESKVDVLITGDKDFDDVIIDTPKIMKPREYIEKYMK